ncbi:uncharacterized protein N7469_000370 [Penicillium citrinum]|uniref:IgE-binding protein n=1 Tax=Penicillium citrinum TaxID=5077 RepID=A0A9W9PCW9_PENCI|nr:uncharacterized protein N7469_000370 [Penicillium citrinum]KAJ5242043.1 hypothetical protein N7469_000370 [Penicillium citrinum]
MKVSALLSLIPLVAAMPGRRQESSSSSSGSFGVTAARSGSPIHFLPLTASGSHFYLGGKSQTYTPEGVPLNKATNDTILTGSHYLDVVVPGGQEIYVDASGALSFTQPHSAYIPEGSSEGPFKYTPGKDGGLGSWSYGNGFIACPTSNATATPYSRRRAASAAKWQVFSAQKNATVPTGNINDCLGFDALTVPINTTITQPAWEYI